MAKSPDIRAELLKLTGKKIAADLENAVEQFRKNIDEKVAALAEQVKSEPRPEPRAANPFGDLFDAFFTPPAEQSKGSDPVVKVDKIVVDNETINDEPIVITRNGITYEFDNMNDASYLNIGPAHGAYAASKIIEGGKVIKDRAAATRNGITVEEFVAEYSDPDATEPVVLKGPAVGDGPEPVRVRKAIRTVNANSEAEAWLFVFTARDKGWEVSNPRSPRGGTTARLHVDVYSVDFRTSLVDPEFETRT